MHTACYIVPAPAGAGHDGRDAGGRATQGAIAEDEGGLTPLALTPALPEGEGENTTHYLLGLVIVSRRFSFTRATAARISALRRTLSVAVV